MTVYTAQLVSSLVSEVTEIVVRRPGDLITAEALDVARRHGLPVRWRTPMTDRLEDGSSTPGGTESRMEGASVPVIEASSGSDELRAAVREVVGDFARTHPGADPEEAVEFTMGRLGLRGPPPRAGGSEGGHPDADRLIAAFTALVRYVDADKGDRASARRALAQAMLDLQLPEGSGGGTR